MAFQGKTPGPCFIQASLGAVPVATAYPPGRMRAGDFLYDSTANVYWCVVVSGNTLAWAAFGGGGSGAEATARRQLVGPYVYLDTQVQAVAAEMGLGDHGAIAAGYVPLRNGSITGITISSSIAVVGPPSAGIVVKINGVASGTAVLALSNGNSKAMVVFAPGAVPITAGDVITVFLTGADNWVQYPANVTVFFEVQLNDA